MGNHLVLKHYAEDAIRPGSMVFFKGRMSRVVSLVDGTVTFDNDETWKPFDGEPYEVSETEELNQGSSQG